MRHTAGVGRYTAVILAGGAAKRLGGIDKAILPVDGVPMIERVRRAVEDASATIVVGPPGLPVPTDVLVVREQPPGGGPVAGLAAAIRAALDTVFVGVFAADLPLLTNQAVHRLLAAVESDGAVYVDESDREQWLCGVWRTRKIRDRLDEIEPEGASLRQLFNGLDFARVRASDDEQMPPWFDCDTQDDVTRVERWLER